MQKNKISKIAELDTRQPDYVFRPQSCWGYCVITFRHRDLHIFRSSSCPCRVVVVAKLNFFACFALNMAP